MTIGSPDRVLLFTRGLTGALNNSLEMARLLERAGSHVVIAGPPRAAARVEANGHHFHLLDGDEREREAHRADFGAGGLRATIRGWGRRRRFDRLTEIHELVDRERPDVLVAEIEMHVAIVATRRLGVPIVLLSPWCALECDLRFPPMHTALVPGTGAARMRGVWEWAKLVIGRLWRQEVRGRLHWRRSLTRLTTPVSYLSVDRRDLARLARRHGYSLWRIASQRDWLNPQSYPDDVLLSAVVPSFDLASRRRPKHHQIGPLIRRDRIEAEEHERARVDLRAFCDRMVGEGRRVVYCAVGTRSRETRSIANRVVEAFAGDPTVAVIVGLGGQASADDVEWAADSNVLVLDYAPQLEVLARCDVAVIHGGIGSIHECLAFGVPMVVHAGGDGDQPGCAVRVEYHSLGRRIDLDAATPGEIRAMTEAVLNDASIAEAVSSASQEIAELERSALAVRIISQVADAGPGARGDASQSET